METAAPTVPAKGLFARAIGIMTSPKATFEAILAHPKPAGIMLLSIVITAFAAAGPQFTEQGRQIVLSQQIQTAERSSGQPISDDQRARMESFSKYTPYASVVSIFIFTPVVVLIFSAIYWVLFNTILGGTATFRHVMTVVAHSSIIGAVGAAIGAPIMFAQGKFSPVGPFNLGALAASADPDSFLRHFLGSISLFQVWGILATSIGLAVLYRRKVGGIATTLLLIYGGFTAVIAYFFGRFMGS